ncbi:DUF6090 family protein [Lentiprolixibacter aurantiacus]|uniref:DUF6090 family protein n=1 Tax=Lentiprolixibacter aurantiacus TaxID=2993939 RepID=A0AAE3MLA2_9FLAO|nr:DUF6090 family protein [Lentiprolixibacter aurantiacus]MCX2719523.1 DUF6090 family protein [Lentiprolixibacter aurantiacus]
MIKLFRNTRKKLLVEKQFTRYLAYAIGEIILVVVGILIALQINTWNNQRIEDREEAKTYENIRRQIKDDQRALNDAKLYNEFHLKAYKYANKIIISENRQKADSLAIMAMLLSRFSDFHRSSNIYETLVNSGELRLLKNTAITQKLQQLEMTYTFVNKLEVMHWDMISNELPEVLRGVVNYNDLKAVLPDKLYDVDMQNMFVSIIYLSETKDEVYRKALSEIEELIGLINAEVPYEDD